MYILVILQFIADGGVYSLNESLFYSQLGTNVFYIEQHDLQII